MWHPSQQLARRPARCSPCSYMYRTPQQHKASLLTTTRLIRSREAGLAPQVLHHILCIYAELFSMTLVTTCTLKPCACA